MKKKSSSFHQLNADTGLKNFQKPLYFFLNRVNNALPDLHVDSEMEIRQFTCDNLQAHWSRLATKTSPTRRMSDLFWMTLPWEKIQQELGSIHILDIGCGKGAYCQWLDNFSGCRIARYLGIDVQAHPKHWDTWKEAYPFADFRQMTDGNLGCYIAPDTNLFMSQASLEHIDEDLDYFDRIRAHIQAYGRPVLQIHLMPSNAGLDLFRFHGIRQYTPRTLSKVTRLFKPFSKSYLYKLGGKACYKLHLESVTRPELVLKTKGSRETDPEAYENALFDSMAQDMSTPQDVATNYALVIHSNINTPVF